MTPLPTFVVIGAQKSATRWLRMNLGAHPEVYTAPREIGFFNSKDRYGHGLDWYRSQFPDWDGEPIVGEASPAYLMWRQQPADVAERMLTSLGPVQLIAILRNPVDRARSALVHHEQRGRLPSGTDLIEYVARQPPERDPLGVISGGWYAASLRPFQERFGDHLLVLIHDDLADDAAGVYRTALAHIGADPTFVPRALEQMRFSNSQRAEALGAADANRTDELSAAERAQLYDYFRADVDDLQAMIGRDVTQWDPTRRG